MIKSKNVGFEEYFIQSLLFENSNDLSDLIKKLNYDKFVNIVSRHLIIPSIYYNLKKKKLLRHIDKKLIKYIEFIYNKNYERNDILIVEVDEISNLFISNEINHVFLKGVSNIKNNIYESIGERMIGDIDVLVEDGDGLKASNLLEKNGYRKISKYSFTRHLPRMVKKGKLFAIEIHTNFFDDSNFYIDRKVALKNKIFSNGVYCLNKKNQYKLNIYNQMINDKSYYYYSYSYKNYYDEFLLRKKYKISHNELCSDKFFNTFFNIKNEVFLKNTFDKRATYNIYFKIRYFLRTRFKLYFYIDNFFVKSYLFFSLKPSQFLRILKNKQYRKYLMEKLFN